MPQFMLTLFDSPATAPDVSPEEMQRIVGEYGAWAQKLQAEGRYVDGSKLTDDGGRVMTQDARGEIQVVDGPFSETKEVLGGFFIVRAASYDDAVELARTCPHLKYSPKLVVRQIDLFGEDG